MAKTSTMEVNQSQMSIFWPNQGRSVPDQKSTYADVEIKARADGPNFNQ